MRWERQWERKEEGQPFKPIEDYIPDSMTTVSTHDCETLPIWWVQLVDEAKAYCNFKHWAYKVTIVIQDLSLTFIRFKSSRGHHRTILSSKDSTEKPFQ